MPASYQHEVIALEAGKLLSPHDQELARLLAAHQAALLAGAQGADPFFFYKFFTREESIRSMELGDRLHSIRTADFLLALMDRAKAAGDAARAFALGYLCHYAADTVIHPYVYAHSFDKEGRYSGPVHCGLEAAMDTAAYRAQGFERGVPRQMNGIAALPEAEAASIARVMAGAVIDVFPGERISPAMVLDSFRWSVRIVRALHSPSGIKYRLLSWLCVLISAPGLVEAHALPRRLPDWDFTNRSGAEWRNPWMPEPPSRQTLAQLVEAATQRAMELMRGAAALWGGGLDRQEMRATLGDLHYSSGLPWQSTAPLKQGMLAREVEPGA